MACSSDERFGAGEPGPVEASSEHRVGDRKSCEARRELSIVAYHDHGAQCGTAGFAAQSSGDRDRRSTECRNPALQRSDVARLSSVRCASASGSTTAPGADSNETSTGAEPAKNYRSKRGSRADTARLLCMKRASRQPGMPPHRAPLRRLLALASASATSHGAATGRRRR